LTVGLRKAFRRMFGATLVMAFVSLGAIVTVRRAELPINPSALRALEVTLSVLPLLFFALLTAELVQSLISPEMIGRWLGSESGVRGLAVGTLAGALAPGGPFVSFPLIAVMMKSGAGVGTMIAFISSWSLLGLSRIPLEFSVVGWKFVIVRIACTFFIPPLVGYLAQMFFGDLKWS